MADWLQSCGVKTVVMQSTGVYWIPLYEILEERGFEVHLVNARHTKNLPGRKSAFYIFGTPRPGIVDRLAVQKSQNRMVERYT